KPMPEIYKAFTAKFSLLPEECVFIDDAAANVAGAVACGWQGIVFHGDSEELAEKLKKILAIHNQL
ncbi:MAG: HAD-IA family hydrolase, partial [Clostridia bacterium]